MADEPLCVAIEQALSERVVWRSSGGGYQARDERCPVMKNVCLYKHGQGGSPAPDGGRCAHHPHTFHLWWPDQLEANPSLPAEPMIQTLSEEVVNELAVGHTGASAVVVQKLAREVLASRAANSGAVPDPGANRHLIGSHAVRALSGSLELAELTDLREQKRKYEVNFVINELREILEAPSNQDIQSKAVEVMTELRLLRKAATESKVFQIAHEITITVEAGSSWATVEIAPIYDPAFTGMPMDTRFGLAVLR